MAKIEEYAEIRTAGGVFRDWITVAVAQSYEQSWIRTFRLQVAEPSRKTLLLKPNDRVDIALAGEVVIQEGYIVTRQVGYDANRHGVQVDGFSKAGTITKASVDVPGGQFRGYKVDAIANSVLKPYGLKFRVEGGPDGWDLPFPNVAVRHGETPFALISRLCKQRGLWLRADKDGTLVAGAKEQSDGIVFEEGKNILAANCQITMPAVNFTVGRSQQPGSDSLFGKRAAEVSAKSEMKSGATGKRIFLNEMPASERELQLRTNMEVAAIESSILRVSLTYQGWLKPGKGGLWDLSESVTVKSPMLFPTEDGSMLLRLWAYAYSQDANAGTTTTLELVGEKTFGLKYADARKDDGFYSPQATPAQPEQST